MIQPNVVILGNLGDRSLPANIKDLYYLYYRSDGDLYLFDSFRNLEWNLFNLNITTASLNIRVITKQPVSKAKLNITVLVTSIPSEIPEGTLKINVTKRFTVIELGTFKVNLTKTDLVTDNGIIRVDLTKRLTIIDDGVFKIDVFKKTTIRDTGNLGISVKVVDTSPM